MPGGTHWCDPTATIADGRVVITPVEADSLYCLNLADGTLAWDPLPQADEVYVAGIHHGKIILVGVHGVCAIRLDDGGPAWEGRMPAFPPTSPSVAVAMPAAIGITSPSPAEIMAVDLDEGKIVQVSKRRGTALFREIWFAIAGK